MASCRDIIERHVSIRRFKSDPVPEEHVEEIIWAARRAPSAWGLQPVSVVVVRDLVKRKAIAEAVGGQRHVEEAPLFLAFVADYAKLLEASRSMGVEPVEPSLGHLAIALVDVGIASAWAALRAEELGYGTVYIALYSACSRVSEILGLPRYALPVVGLAVGKPAEHPAPQPRQPPRVFAYVETYGDVREAAEVITRDQAYASKIRRVLRLTLAPSAYYEEVGRELARCAAQQGFRLEP